jgi:cytochrome c
VIRVVAAAVAVLALLVVLVFGREDARASERPDAFERGREAIERHGCGSCHTIPGVRRARGLVGPPLAGIASRSYVAGVLENRPENLAAWILDPPGVDPLTAMPNLGVTAGEAHDIAAFLYTLK